MPKLFDLAPDERRAAAYAALCHFCVLFSWYLVRPFREALGIRDGFEALPYLTIGTLIAAGLLNPVIARVLDRRARVDAMRHLYRAVQVVLIAFFIAFQLIDGREEVWLGYGFFATVSVLNLLIVSTFWSLANEAFDSGSAQRAFGPAAAGGSLGGLLAATTVSLLGDWFEEDRGRQALLLIASAVVLEGAIHAGRLLLRAAPRRATPAAEGADDRGELAAFHGSALSGWRDLAGERFVWWILGYMLFHAFAGTWAYFVQGRLVHEAGGQMDRFAWIDMATNCITLLFQLLLVGRFVKRLGVGWTLSVLPALSAIGFLLLSAAPSYAGIAVFQTLRRAASYGFSKPTREMLFSIFTVEQKYKLKNLVDVAGYRAADLIASAAHIGVDKVTIGTAGVSGIAAGLCVVWLGYNLLLGQAFLARARAPEAAR